MVHHAQPRPRFKWPNVKQCESSEMLTGRTEAERRSCRVVDYPAEREEEILDAVGFGIEMPVFHVGFWIFRSTWQSSWLVMRRAEGRGVRSASGTAAFSVLALGRVFVSSTVSLIQIQLIVDPCNHHFSILLIVRTSLL